MGAFNYQIRTPERIVRPARAVVDADVSMQTFAKHLIALIYPETSSSYYDFHFIAIVVAVLIGRMILVFVLVLSLEVWSRVIFHVSVLKMQLARLQIHYCAPSP